MKKWHKHLLLTIAACSFCMTPRAALATGYPVFDASSMVQSLLSNLNMVRQYATQAQQYSAQMRQYAAQMQNLQSLNYMVDLSGLRDMQKIMQESRGIANDYAALQREYDKLYPDFSKFSTMSGKDYAKKAMEWTQQTANTNRDAMNLLSKSKDWFNSDSGDLQRLTIKANRVSGAKDALQAAAQISALQSKQLLQLQQTMSASAKVEGTYMQQKAEQEAAAMAQMKKHVGDVDKEIRTLQSAQKPPGRMLYER